MNIITSNYVQECLKRNDINEHLPTLCRYASECSTVGEMGVRSVISTWAFLQGLLDSKSDTKSLQCLDIEDVSSIPNVIQIAKENGIDLSFTQGDSAITPLKPVDLLFIDTWHVYGHLKRELAFHCDSVKKYIIMHDTTVDAIAGESIRMGMNIASQVLQSGYPEHEIRKGLKAAIDEFLIAHPEWVVKEVFTNNNGLTVLERLSK